MGDRTVAWGRPGATRGVARWLVVCAATVMVLSPARSANAAACDSTTPITCGQTLAGAISTFGEEDCFTFTANANETVSVTTQLTAGFFQPCWTLEDTLGSISPKICGQGTRTVAVAGTYKIHVFDNPTPLVETGAYDVNMVVVSDTGSNCAEPIVCSDTLARSTSSVGESDTFRFVGAAGETLSITAQETGGGLLACWELYDPSGGSLGDVCGQGERTLAVPGGYTLRVHDNTESKTGTYDANLVVVSDTVSNCAETIGCGSPLARNIGNVGEADTFVFASEAHETVSITAQETGGGMSACWDLYDPQGIRISTACGQAEKTLAVAGNYTIRIYDNNDVETGTYDVDVVFVSDTASSCAESIGCGQNLPRSIDAVGQSNTYRFTGDAGETISITAQETSAFLAACWELYDPAGISVVGACGQGEKTLAVAGDYTIRVFDNGDGETGTYDVDVVVVSDSVHNCAEPILCGQTLDRSIGTTGESDTYRFSAAAGEAVSIASTETGGFIDACWEIYDPDGISLGGICGQAEKTLAVAGGYTIRVSDNNDQETGTYDVNLVVISDTAHNCAQPLACGDVVTGSLDLKAESDTYRVSGQTGDVVKIETEEVGGMLNACWEFYDPTGASLGGVCGADSRTLATNLGAYTLRVFDQGENDSGDYQVTLCNPTTTTTTTLGSGSSTTTTLPGGGDELHTGTGLLLKDAPGKPQKRRLLVTSRDASVTLGSGAGTGDDPTLFGGSLRIASAAGGFDTTYVLETIGWRQLKRRDPTKGWKYTKGNAIKLALVKAGSQLRISGKGAGLVYGLAADPNPVDVVLTLGARRYCLRFGGTPRFTPNKLFKATGAPAPDACP